MLDPKADRFVRFVLLSNGVVDLGAALSLFFPILGLGLPGYGAYTPEIAFVAGGWGIAALTFGIGRIWASFKPELHPVMVVLGLIEGTALSLFCVGSVLFLGLTWLQVMLALAVGSVFGLLYWIAWFMQRRRDPRLSRITRVNSR